MVDLVRDRGTKSTLGIRFFSPVAFNDAHRGEIKVA